MSMITRSSKATLLWLSILGAVLAFLFLETSGPAHRGYNFFLSTDSAAVGAEIWVDGQKVDVVAGASRSGMAGGAWWGHLTRGKHVIEVKMPGYAPLLKEIDMRGEEYLGVDLKPLKD